MIAITLGSLALFVLTSCGGPKYGCGNGHPRENWNKMVRRINSPR